VEERPDAWLENYPYKFRTLGEGTGQLNENKPERLVPRVGVEPT
jgi:hypothetical protein